VKRGFAPRSDGSYAGKLAVIEQQAFKPRSWSNIHRFGCRWMVESAISSFKRAFGEHVTSVKWKYMVNELLLKASVYSMFLSARA
jgi:hypothetical protein